jgi:HD superfamily phosphodiesterase
MTMKNNKWQSWVKILEEEFKEHLSCAPFPSDAHKIDHIHRVWQHCKNLGLLIDADMEILIAGAYLHDLGRHHIKDKAHGALGSELAKPILERINFPNDKRSSVLHAIRVHDVTFQSQDRNSTESKILFDADKLDSFGVIGTVRNILVYYGKKPIDYILDDLALKWNGLSLDETREYAQQEYDYIKNFYSQLKQELTL